MILKKHNAEHQSDINKLKEEIKQLKNKNSQIHKNTCLRKILVYAFPLEGGGKEIEEEGGGRRRSLE